MVRSVLLRGYEGRPRISFPSAGGAAEVSPARKGCEKRPRKLSAVGAAQAGGQTNRAAPDSTQSTAESRVCAESFLRFVQKGFGVSLNARIYF
jgi:hypothetical protein